jgi:hypothetical protein
VDINISGCEIITCPLYESAAKGRTGTIDMNRRTGFAFSMILIGLWWGQTAISQSGIISLLTGILAVTLTCFGGGILSGVFQPDAIADEEMSTLASHIITFILIVGVLSLLMIVLLPYL